MPNTNRPTPPSATLDDFRHFHGMLCGPSTAARCMGTFAQGSMLFVPHDYTSRLAFCHVPNGGNTLGPLLFYYAIVLLSLTGLWALLGWTQHLVARQENGTTQWTRSSSQRATISSTSHPKLVLQPSVIEYLFQQYPRVHTLALQRSFEYDFDGLISVIMWHLQDNQGVWHLVEVYQVHHPVARYVTFPIMAGIGSLMMQLWALCLPCCHFVDDNKKD